MRLRRNPGFKNGVNCDNKSLFSSLQYLVRVMNVVQVPSTLRRHLWYSVPSGVIEDIQVVDSERLWYIVEAHARGPPRYQ